MATEIKMGGRDELEALLKDIEVDYSVREHPAVFTVEEMMPVLDGLTGGIAKNLFLYDKKKKNLYLLSCQHDAQVNLSELAKKISAPGALRLAKEELMVEKIGVSQGHLNALALFNDTENNIKFVCDRRFLDGTFETVSFHPMTNTATLTMPRSDFQRFLERIGHEPVLVDF